MAVGLKRCGVSIRGDSLKILESRLQTLEVVRLGRWNDVDAARHFFRALHDPPEGADHDVRDAMSVERREQAERVEPTRGFSHGSRPDPRPSGGGGPCARATGAGSSVAARLD